MADAIEGREGRPVVVNLRKEPYDVYIGRGSAYGNPFRIGPDGTRDEVIVKYRTWLTAQPRLILQAQHELPGKRLGCYCKPLACHGDVLVEAVVDANLGFGSAVVVSLDALAKMTPQQLEARRAQALQLLVDGYEILHPVVREPLGPEIAGIMGKPGPPYVRGYILTKATFEVWRSNGFIAREGRARTRGWELWRITATGWEASGRG